MNENFFENVDSEEVSYFVGFLLADGSVGKNSNEIRIQLQERDGDILEKFKNFLGLDAPLRVRKIKDKKYWDLGFSNRKIKTDLLLIGITPNKTQSGKYPKVKDNLFWPFLRGLSDGDGCIFFSEKRKCPSWSLVCHKNISARLKDEIETRTNIHVTVQPHWRTSYIEVISINGNQNVYLFLQYLYDNPKIYLDRKYTKYKRFRGFYERYLKTTYRGKFIGVEKTRSGKYVATIKRNDKKQYLGRFLTAQEASDAYDKRLVELHGRKCITNKMIKSFVEI